VTLAIPNSRATAVASVPPRALCVERHVLVHPEHPPANQPAPDPGWSCFNGLFPSAATVAGDGGSSAITVSAPAGCNWTASSGASWVTLQTLFSSGSVMLGYTVAPNSGSTRTATLTVGGAPFTVTQGAAGTTGGVGSPGIGGGGAGGSSWPSTLTAEQVLSTLQSPDGRFLFTYRSDGNIVLSQGTAVLWSSGTSGPGYAVMQGDGNFVSFAVGGEPSWHTNTWGHPGATLMVQNDGSVVIRDSAGAQLWSTGTGTGTGDPSACTYTVSPQYFVIGSSGASRSLTIVAPVGCVTSISSRDSWVSMDTPQGIGTWTTTVTVAGNTSTDTRATILQLPGVVVVVDQNGVGTDASRFEMLGLTVAGADSGTATLSWGVEPGTNQKIAQVCTPICSSVISVVASPPGLGWINWAPDGPCMRGAWWDLCGGAGRDQPIGGVTTFTPDEPNCIVAPPTVSIIRNVGAASAYAQAVEIELGILNPFATIVKMSWMVSMFYPNRPMDYVHTLQNNSYRAFGNYNYGMVGRALGLDRQTLYDGAGFAQWAAGHWLPEYGLPGLAWPYGDNQEDHAVVERAINDFEAGRVNVCRLRIF
jgi:hypothetical protein